MLNSSKPFDFMNKANAIIWNNQSVIRLDEFKMWLAQFLPSNIAA